MSRIYKNMEIEDIVESRLEEYEKMNGKISEPPVPIDKIIEDCGFDFLYTNIEEESGECILGALNKDENLIVLNENHMDLFKEKPGLECSTKAHELGHWDIFEKNHDYSENLSLGIEEYKETVFYRDSNAGKVKVLPNFWKNKEIYNAIKSREIKSDHPYVASAVERYGNSLLLPKKLILKYCKNEDLLNWPNLYRLAELFNVTISAFTVRLQRLKMLHIEGKELYNNKEEVQGQQFLKLG